ncbi:MAG: Gfo/Idh/MocA family oxidoreductase, partial [Myxococcales bacterium]
MTPVRLVLAGVGAWGRHLARLAAGSPRVALVGLVDPDPEALAAAAWRAPVARPFARLDEALGLAPDAVVVATPARSHRALAAAALEAGAAVLVEKPLATSSADAESLVALAQRRRAVAMVGHLLRYHPAIERLLDEVRRGTIGRPRHLHSARRSPPGRASDVSALWALGPHDVSLLLALDGAGPEGLAVAARGDDEVSVQGQPRPG